MLPQENYDKEASLKARMQLCYQLLKEIDSVDVTKESTLYVYHRACLYEMILRTITSMIEQFCDNQEINRIYKLLKKINKKKIKVLKKQLSKDAESILDKSTCLLDYKLNIDMIYRFFNITNQLD